jgi:D-serine deaminase-like pyridoxal phosphate-dependent protein
MQEWFHISNADDVASPSLLLYTERIDQNIEKMIRTAGGVERLRPHTKTHKLPEVVQKQLARGINRFKCATVAEAEMVAGGGAPDVLLAYQLVGPNVQRLCALIRQFPKTRFSTVVDNESSAHALSEAARHEKISIDVFVDIDCGQHRTGIAPGNGAFELYKSISVLTGLKPAGLHAYDGHIHDRDAKARAAACEKAFAPVNALRNELLKSGLPVPNVIAGGTPTFPFHARRSDVECSPGTCVLWDWGYSTNLPDLPFLHAATVLTRVVSRPTANRICLDLGHKAIASEMPHPRVHFPELSDGKPVTHSEEHLVLETDRAGKFHVGQVLYGIPWHICPTVALYSEAIVVTNGRAESPWKITARARRLSI